MWGPYSSALLPGLWLLEGGQSASGKLVDHVIESHPATAEAKGRTTSSSVYHFLEGVLDTMREESVRFLTEFAWLSNRLHFCNRLNSTI